MKWDSLIDSTDSTESGDSPLVFDEAIMYDGILYVPVWVQPQRYLLHVGNQQPNPNHALLGNQLIETDGTNGGFLEECNV